jgi:hypothetical protein
LLEFSLADLAQIVHAGSLSSNNAFCDLDQTTNSSSLANGVLSGCGLNLDQHNSWVFWTTVVLSVTEVAEPCL